MVEGLDRGAAEWDPAELAAEDRDTDKLVERFQAGDREAYGEVYSRYFERVYAYLRVVFKHRQDAEDATQQVFLQVMEALPRYKRLRQPFRAWLFAIVRNHAIDQLRKLAREDLLDPAELNSLREGPDPQAEKELESLGWITDKDLVIFVERLSLPQRQVLLLRFLMGLNAKEIARVLDRTPTDVRGLQHRAQKFLRERLTAIGRAPDPDKKQVDAKENHSMQRWPKPSQVLRNRRFSLM